ncbi:MAG: radical SAM family heme chaperone HemW [Acholeplasma sp.]|nr:radical SAM family heme chaperone HemW [Acholeplasma sp.]
MRGLYVHIPFCEHICFYCDFAKRVAKNNEMIEDYLTHLERDFCSITQSVCAYDTIYIGGGTPSMLSVFQLTRLFEMLKKYTPIEYTIEVNPESYTHEKGLLFKKYGINRVSLGVQSFEKSILDYIGRKHDNEQVFNAVSSLQSIGITNISIDLIFSIPGQNIASISNDLSILATLDVPHVSYYSLILEEKTVFYHKYLKKQFKQTDIDLEADMYELIVDSLKKQGYEQYEISNFAKNGKYSMHNQLYWTMQPYDAIGAGAHGYDGVNRYYNHRLLNEYYQTPLQGSYIETDTQKLSDTLIFGLRRSVGVKIDEINQDFGIDLLKHFDGLDKYFKLGLIEVTDGYLRLTQKGFLLGNQVFEVFI